MTDTKKKLLADCKFVAEELENVGVRTVHTCGQCVNCKSDNGKIYCLENSTMDEDAPEENGYVYEVCSNDDITEHGDWNNSTHENEPCAYFENCPELGEDEKNYESMYDWLSSQLDIEYVITSRGEYKHGIVTTGTGGPHIEVDTRTKTVNGYWGNEEADVSVDSETILRLDEALEEMYESIR